MTRSETSASTSVPARACVASGRQHSDSNLSQLMLKMTKMQSLGFPADSYQPCTYRFPLTPVKLLTVYVVILKKRRIRSCVCPMKTHSGASGTCYVLNCPYRTMNELDFRKMRSLVGGTSEPGVLTRQITNDSLHQNYSSKEVEVYIP